MCGIIGYIGDRNITDVLVEGLKRMEYRGYDSSGVALVNGTDTIFCHKKEGKITNMEKSLPKDLNGVNAGIGHTRWATHGVPSKKNAHPFVDCSNKFSMAHNGIIENFKTLKKSLIEKGCVFTSDTDSEVIIHLIEYFYKGDFYEAVRLALRELWGAYGIVVASSLHPGTIIAARNGSPMVIGKGISEYFVASDVAAFVSYTQDTFPLHDKEVAILTRDSMQVKNLESAIVDRPLERIDVDIKSIEKGGYDHFMLKEIHEQPSTIKDAFRGRMLLDEGTAKLGGFAQVEEKLEGAEKIILTACGTSWHAALVGEYMIEDFARIPVEVEYASEFRYRQPVLKENDVIIAISQSGETADTLAAIQEAKRRKATVLGICNVVGSAIAHETEGGIYTHAGPEIGVASTKAFTSQVVVMALLAIYLGRKHGMTQEKAQNVLRELSLLPDKVRSIVKASDKILEIARKFSKNQNFLYLGRGYNFPVALEGALKLKEISYIHAEGYPAAEMKHGPIALIDESMPVVIIASKSDKTYSKILSNIEEVKARKGRVIAVATEGDTDIKEIADEVIFIPETIRQLSPILSVIPLQLLAYYIAVERGCNVDQPRNLAKSVTVE